MTRPLLASILAFAVAGCASETTARRPEPPKRPRVASPAAEPDPAPARLPDRGWTTISSQRLLLEVPLPDGASWGVEDDGAWLVLRHYPSNSELWIRRWRQGTLSTHRDCEAQVRLWRTDVPETDGAAIESRSLNVPRGFDTRLWVGVEPLSDGRGLAGFALAFGANVRRCLALLYRTQAVGSGAESEIGARLRLIADGVFSRLRARSIDDRARGARMPLP